MVTAAPPSQVTAGTPFGLVISVGTRTASDADSGFTGSVTVTLYNQANVDLGTQTKPVHGGAATFSGFTLDEAAAGYTFTVTSTASGTSSADYNKCLFVVAATPTQVIVTSAVLQDMHHGRQDVLASQSSSKISFENLASEL